MLVGYMRVFKADAGPDPSTATRRAGGRSDVIPVSG
jgi:hypothetical protein